MGKHLESALLASLGFAAVATPILFGPQYMNYSAEEEFKEDLRSSPSTEEYKVNTIYRVNYSSMGVIVAASYHTSENNPLFSQGVILSEKGIEKKDRNGELLVDSIKGTSCEGVGTYYDNPDMGGLLEVSHKNSNCQFPFKDDEIKTRFKRELSRPNLEAFKNLEQRLYF